MGATPLRGLSVAVLMSLASARHVTWILASRGAVVDRVPSSTEAIDALLDGRDQILVSDRLLPGFVVVMQPGHLVAPPFGRSFGDEFVEFMEAPPDPTALAAAVARAARRLGLGVTMPPASTNGTEAA